MRKNKSINTQKKKYFPIHLMIALKRMYSVERDQINPYISNANYLLQQ